MQRDANRKRLLKSFGYLLKAYDEEFNEGVTNPINEEIRRLKNHFERIRLRREGKVIPDFLYN